MALASTEKGTNMAEKDRSYATITDDGVNYRDIANTMSILGHEMNHSSARNYVLRVMRKFVIELAERYDVVLTEEQIDTAARSPIFQSGIQDLLHEMWAGEDGEELFTPKSK